MVHHLNFLRINSSPKRYRYHFLSNTSTVLIFTFLVPKIRSTDLAALHGCSIHPEILDLETLDISGLTNSNSCYCHFFQIQVQFLHSIRPKLPLNWSFLRSIISWAVLSLHWVLLANNDGMYRNNTIIDLWDLHFTCSSATIASWNTGWETLPFSNLVSLFVKWNVKLSISKLF